ncbi:type VI secretion system ImpA family N-terminal domain-containing protein [Pigmentibacter sp. JX0631]|uniref:type VI secretion system protein TssA n=1 Tax=Pigmentibacter sp. JX0631 TaxID=2976982 RepID=UPI0024693B1E|nr:type VI secretion system ImpA family N-terminal domain-containing protein [Pigmentibacter sp. JX0631]WGL60333.1 type VI secretion system ImpA family N-terminal domain-containing protein [Pigmentibacter sp. JX0631]
MEINLLNISQLLEPISKNLPCGEDVMYDENFLQIKRDRQQPENENLGVWVVSDSKETNWNRIEHLCIDLLKNKTKDLMVCCYLLEARLKQYGILGLANSCELLLSISTKYWENVFPALLNENDTRKSPYLWLDEKLPFLLKTLPLFQVKNSSKLIFYKDIELYTGKKEFSDTMQLLFQQDDFEILMIIQDEIQEIEKNLKKLKEFLFSEKLLEDNIFSKIFEIFHQIKKFITSQLKVTKNAEVKKITAPENDFPNLEKEIYYEKLENNTLSRNDIYNNLKKFADMLLEIEPHSPVPLIILRALKWQNRSFLEIVFEVLKISSDQNSLLALFEDTQLQEKFSNQGNDNQYD